MKKKTVSVPPKLTKAEQDLFSHLEDGYQLETDSLSGNPVLRRLKDDNEEIRPLSANRNTIRAMEQRTARAHLPWQRPRPAHYRVASEKENKLKLLLFRQLLRLGTVLKLTAQLSSSVDEWRVSERFIGHASFGTLKTALLLCSVEIPQAGTPLRQ